MKEQGNSPKEELHEIEPSNVSDTAEFRVMILRVLNSMKKKPHRNHKKESFRN